MTFFDFFKLIGDLFDFLDFFKASLTTAPREKDTLSYYMNDLDLEAILGHLGAILGLSWPCWGHPDPSWSHLGTSSGHLRLSWGHLGPSWGHLEAILGRLEANLGPFWAILGPSWGYLRRSYDRKCDILKNVATPTRNAHFAGQDGAKKAPRGHLDGLKPTSEAS